MSGEIATLVQQALDEKNERIATLERKLDLVRREWTDGRAQRDEIIADRNVRVRELLTEGDRAKERIADLERQLAAAQRRSSELFDELGVAQNGAQMQIGELTRQLAEMTADRDNLRQLIEASNAGPLFERLDAQHLRIAELEYALNVTVPLPPGVRWNFDRGHPEEEVCPGCNKSTRSRDCGCPCGTRWRRWRQAPQLSAEQRERIAVNARGKALISHGCGCDDCLKSINVQLELAVLAAIAEVCGPVTEEA